MVNKELFAFVQKSLRNGVPVQAIQDTLREHGWEKRQVEEAIAKVQSRIADEAKVPREPPKPPRYGEWDLLIHNLSVAQILIAIGSIVVLVAGIWYIANTWAILGSGGRVLAILLPTLVLLLTGFFLWPKEPYRYPALAFLGTGGLLFPLFLAVTFAQLQVFSKPLDDPFIFVTSGITLVLYIVFGILFRSPLWAALSALNGLVVYYAALKTLGVDGFLEGSAMAWAFFLPAFFYLFLGYRQERHARRPLSIYWYFIGFSTIILAFLHLAVSGRLLTTFLGEIESGLYPQLIGWSAVIMGLIFSVIGRFLPSLKQRRLEEPARYGDLFRFLGTLAILAGIAGLGSQGALLVYELLLLIVSIGYIAVSIPSRIGYYLSLGTLFLIISILSIGFEYFPNTIGWPITLFIIGILVMGAGVSVQRIRHRFFAREDQ